MGVSRCEALGGLNNLCLYLARLLYQHGIMIPENGRKKCFIEIFQIFLFPTQEFRLHPRLILCCKKILGKLNSGVTNESEH